MMYPPESVPFTSWPQLEGLECGDFVAQRSYDGRRAVKLPGEGLFYRTGRRVTQRPWRELVIPEARIPLDVALTAECAHVLDVMMPVPFMERVATAQAWGVVVDYVPVFSIEEVNELLLDSLSRGGCDGVVLKRVETRYPWSPLAPQQLSGWLKVKRVIEQRGAR
jgi:hypothetical protein